MAGARARREAKHNKRAAKAIAAAIVERAPWVTCPDCGVGPGADHVKGCPRGRRPTTPVFVKQRRKR